MKNSSFIQGLRFLLQSDEPKSDQNGVNEGLIEIDAIASRGGSEAVVENKIEPGEFGRVRYQASRWKARCNSAIAIAENSRVRVLGRQGLTLVVEPIEPICFAH
ncbi:NfeD family protein [Sphaerothrix gracilis]|uniref:NfeD family protein n=1 Tax=Sphaerothrix gracilis TaxID=3151835 RepID=UPI0031FC5626